MNIDGGQSGNCICCSSVTICWLFTVIIYSNFIISPLSVINSKFRYPTFSPLLQALCERCDRLRPSLFRLASDTVEDDAALAQILSANDELTLVVNAYKDQVRRRESNGGRERSKSEEEVPAQNKGKLHLDTFFFFL